MKKKTEEEWKKILSPERYRILREKGTEPPFCGRYHLNKRKGTYVCAACGQMLFSSEAKYESGTGWPSYFTPIKKENIEEKEDSSHGMRRLEVVCSRCGSHLGHVFPDGPPPTGKRYCINSLSLEFKAEEKN
jgi:peptide-methionine (R)-S-oxide reductase